MKKIIPQWGRVEIELQSNCNRDCSFCPRFYDRTGIRKDGNGKAIKREMPTDKVYAIIDSLYNYGYKGRITFHRLSEPTLDKRYLEFVKYAFSKGLIIQDHTNGDILKNDEKLCEELDGYVDKLTIGLYDYNKNKEKQETIKFWRSRFKKTKIRFSKPLERANTRQNSNSYKTDKKNKEILKEACNRTNALLIRYDGEVSLCCEDDNCNFGLGNVFTESINNIWYSEKHTEIYNNLQKENSRKQYKLCSKCYSTRKNQLTFFEKKKKKILQFLWRRNLINIKTLNPQVKHYDEFK